MSEANTTQVSIGFDGPPEPKWLFYVLSFFLPAAGIVMGAIFASISDTASKEFGKYCLIIATIPVALLILFYVLYFVLVIVYVAIIIIVGASFGALGDMSIIDALPGFSALL
ncbi:MAG: hypothetical protein GY771_14875 [bacterium]|nr:hypothetical protein [bacterium]